MPFNGSGTYTAPASPGAFNPAVTGSSATPAAWNTLLDDIETALSTVITKDGQTTVTANIPMGGFRITGLGDGTAATDAATVKQLGQTVSTLTGAVATGTTTIPFDDTIPQNTEGDEYMTRAITPKSATSTLVIEVTWNGAHSAIGTVTAALFQDTTANALAASSVTPGAADRLLSIVFTYTMTSGTTSATTFKVRAGSSVAGTTTFNGAVGARRLGGVMASSITIREVL